MVMFLSVPQGVLVPSRTTNVVEPPLATVRLWDVGGQAVQTGGVTDGLDLEV